MNKKGFTLIELLAVIVVLGIVMVIATTTVLPYLKNIKKQSFISEANSLRKAAENATELIANGIITTNKYTKISNGYCFSIDDLKALGMFTKDDVNYKGSVRAIRDGNKFTYQVGLKTKEYYVPYIEGDIKVDDVKDVTEDFTVNYTCEISGQAYAILIPTGEKENGNDLYELTFLRSESVINEGDIYNGKTIFKVYNNIEDVDWDFDIDGIPNISWYDYRDKIRSIVFKDEIIPKSTVGWFAEMKIPGEIDVSRLNLSKATKTIMMFSACEVGSIKGTSGWDMSNIERLEAMFAGAKINGDLNLNGWNMLKASKIAAMLGGATINGNLYFNNLKASKVTDMSYMFYNADVGGYLELKDWTVNSVTNMSYMFYNATIKGNLIIAGHSGTGWKAFFNDLYKLGIGDDINVTYNNQNYTYKMIFK